MFSLRFVLSGTVKSSIRQDEPYVGFSLSIVPKFMKQLCRPVVLTMPAPSFSLTGLVVGVGEIRNKEEYLNLLEHDCE